MDPAAPAVAPPGQAPAPAPAQAPVQAQIGGREVSGNERGSLRLGLFLYQLIFSVCPRETGLWRPWLPSINDRPRQAAAGATAAEVTKAESGFRHPVRLFWPKSRSFDYLYSAGEMLLQNFPVQATINLYEDSDSEEDGEDKQENVEEELNEIGPEGCAKAPEATPHKATALSPDPPLTCPN
ncbi:protein ripply1 [Arvicola amphibius]|uniref:protein ripply1 n=1 Tax=Arvicola amphibius TaxID=1047088 RepID=UPI0018E2CDB0|nr:protein ripply1 [Arvicola amphibius]